MGFIFGFPELQVEIVQALKHIQLSLRDSICVSSFFLFFFGEGNLQKCLMEILAVKEMLENVESFPLKAHITIKVSIQFLVGFW